jgi:ABC-2 type transport system permease protein
MKPIILTELRRRRMSIFWWTLGLVALVSLTLAFYPSIKSQTAELNKSFGNLSPTVTNLFSDTGDFFSPVGYLSSQIFYQMLPLLLSALAISLGSSLLAREEQEGTIELLLARPISRGRLLLAKALSGLLILAIVEGLCLLCTVVLAAVVNTGIGIGGIVFVSILALLMATMLGAISLALTALGGASRRASIGIASLVGLAGYLATSFESSVHWMVWPARFLPFHYYHPANILRGTYSWGVAVAFIAITLVLAVIAWLGFRRRDIA